jgi:tRNA A37 N6-isopentenylltransferase MiaA
MLIHVIGPSGSGKTTIMDNLIKKYKGKINTIDTDQLAEDGFIYLLCNNKKYLKRVLALKYSAAEKMLVKLINQKMMNIINESKKKGKILVIVGFSNMVHLKATHGFFIKSKLDESYKRKTLRTLDYIIRNAGKIRNVIHKSGSAAIYDTLTLGLKLRGVFPESFDRYKNDSLDLETEYKALNYYIGDKTDVENKIIGIISETHN